MLCVFALSIPVSTAMVAHWDFNGASGTTVTESVSGYNATIYGGAALNGTGRVYLDGSDDYVSMPVGSVISGLGSFTITAKINFSGAGSSWQRIFSFNNSTSEFMHLVFTNTAEDEILFKCRHDEHDEVTYATKYSSLAGEHYFAITLNTSTKIARAYIDGQLIGENKWADFSPSLLGSTVNNWIGKSEYSTGAYFRGYIDDFRIYNNVLTPAEISQLAGFNGAIEPSPPDRTTGTEQHITLGWDSSGTVNGFDVYFGDNLSSVTTANNSMPVGGVYKGRISQEYFTVSNLEPRTTYYWRIDAIDGQGNPITGKIWRFTTIPNGTPIKVMCFNIKYDNLSGMPSLTDANAWIYAFGTDRKERVINMITSESESFGSSGPDILGPQEVTSNQKNDLQNAMPGYGFYGVIGDADIEYCGIFYRTSRFTLLDSGTFWLSETPDVAGSIYPGAAYARIASWVILEDSENQQSYFVMNTHWDHVSKEANYFAAQLIRDKIDELANGLPVIIMGDLNTQESENPYFRLIGNEDPAGLQLTDTYRYVYPRKKDDEVTCHGWKGGTYGNRIDFIFHSNEFYSGRAMIEHNRVLGKYPSDHYPVTATIYYREILPADLNQDGTVNFEDLKIFTSDWLETGYYIPADQIGLAGHWDFEGAAGTTTAIDSAGDNDAIIIGTSLNGSGGVTLAGGTNVQYVDLGSGVGSVISGLTNSTVIIDFSWDGAAAGTFQKPWTFSQAGTTQFGLLTFVSSNESYIRFQHRYLQHDESTDASTPLLTGRHQIAVATNAAYGTYGSVQIYLDGVQKAFRTQEARADLSLLGQTTRNYLGKSPYDAGIYFDGTIYDFRIYNRYLSADEIADIYNGTPEQIYVPLESASNFHSDEIINFLDFVIFADSWLESQ